MTPKLKNKVSPRVIMPSDITDAKKHFTGPLTGYYVSNTNIYNILPNNSNLDIDAGHNGIIGIVVGCNILTYLPDSIKKNINLLTSNNPQGSTRIDRLTLKREPNVSTSTPADFFNSVLPLIVKSGHSEFQFNDEFLVGYWDNDELHLIQTGTLTEVEVETYSLTLDVFSRNTGILESEIMLRKGAMFIGCGSVGSLVAVELAKAGVGRFLLIDNDVFGYHNICRHQCGIYDVGRYKVDAVADRILQINPYATIIKRHVPVQDVDRDEIEEFLGDNSIIIGGADNREGDLYANQFSVKLSVPFMSIGCWERAFAGEIFYSLPPNMPDYSDFIAAIGYTSGRVTQNRRFYTTEADLEKVSFEPGISADINFVTIVAVKLAIDILNKDTEGYTQRLLPHLTQYTLVCNTNNTDLGGEQAAIFSYPLQVTTSIKVPYANPDVTTSR